MAKRKDVKMTRAMQNDIVKTVADGSLEWLASVLLVAIGAITRKGWKSNLKKLYNFVLLLASGEALTRKNVPFTVFIRKGNSKLPFVAFSALPGKAFCPGAGDCLKFCYSFKGWRYPACFCRQIQNTLLLATPQGRAFIANEFRRIPLNRTVRLYVDGDFDSVETVSFWFNLLPTRPDLNVYGYSKSFSELLAYDGKMPENYTLNISSGHKHDSATVKAIEHLSITRGLFIAVGKKGKLAYNTREYRRVALEAAKQAGYNKVFVCPGKCGECTAKQHACGDKDRFNNIPVVILAH